MSLSLFQSISGRVDKDAGIIYGVSVVSVGEAKGHGKFVDQTTLKQVKAAADAFASGVKVKLNHDGGVAEIVGVLKNFSIDGEHLRADLHLLKSHEDFKYLLDLATEIPEGFGLSISFSGVPEVIGEKTYARCSELYSIDLVAEPAANPAGLFARFAALLGFRRVDMPTLGMSTNETPQSPAPVQEVPETKTEATTVPVEATQFEAAKAKVTELESEVARLTQEISALQSKAVTADKVAAVKAQEIVASLGVPPVAITSSSTPKDEPSTAAEWRMQFSEIKDARARAEFWRKHEAQILR